MNDPISAGLLEVAGPQLYRRNAFRITGLPTDADRRTVRHRQQKIIPALEMGIDLDLGHSLPVEPDDVRRAFDLILGDPRRRLVDELFWLWDTPQTTCGCTKALHEDHDQAVKAHSAALDKESLGDSLTDDELDELETLWAEASRLWNKALRRASFWDHVRHRITTLDDRQLTESAVDLLRDELPLTLVKPLIQLATTSVSEPTWLAEQARTWPVPSVVVDDQLELAAEPIYDLVKTNVAEARTTLDAGDTHKAASLLYETVLPELKRLNAVVPAARHRRTASVRNEVALAFNNCAVALIDSDGPEAERSGRKWFSAAKKLTQDEHTLALIEQNTSTLNDIVAAFRTIKQRVDEFRSYGRTDLARQMLRNIRREMAGEPGIAAINKMLEELGDPTARRWEAEYQRAQQRGATGVTYRRPGTGRARRVITWVVVLIALLIIYLLFFDGPSVKAAQLFAPKSGDNAAVGTCIQTKEGWNGPKSEVPTVPCDSEHWGEVIGYVSLAATVPSPYPGDVQTEAQARYNCLYIRALKRLDGQYTVDYVRPSSTEWNDGTKPEYVNGQNYATCVLHREDDSPLPDRQLGQPEDTANVTWTMDLYTTNLAMNPPVGACIHTSESYYRDIHRVTFVGCAADHWGEVIGYPVLALGAQGVSWDPDMTTKAQSACMKLAADRGLGEQYRTNAGSPQRNSWNESAKEIFTPCVVNLASGAALRGQVG